MNLTRTTIASLVLCSTLVAQDRTQPSDVGKLLAKRTLEGGGPDLPYRLLEPDGYDADGDQRYPLVVFLHGIGERGADNERQLRNGVEHFVKESTRRKHPCFLVVPQCPRNDTWSQLNPRRNVRFVEQPTRAGQRVLDLIEAVRKEFRVDEDRIYLTGLSMGGFGTWDLIVRRPDLFAAAIPVCGGGDPEQAGKLAKLPIWALHGGADRLVPPERSRDMVAAIERAGGNVKYTEFEGVGHDSWVPAYRDPEVLDWLFARKRTADSQE